MHLYANPTPRWLSLVVVASAFAVTGCSSGGAVEPADPSVSASGTDGSSQASEAGASATPSVSPSPPPSSHGPGETDVLAAYTRYLDSTVAAMEAGDPAEIESARGQALAAAQGRVAALTSQGRTARGAFVPEIQMIEVEGDTARLRDCYRADVTEHDDETGDQVADRAGIRFGADVDLAQEDDGWIVVEFNHGDPCVPDELARTLERRYVDFWDAVAVAGRPPDPDHADLADTAAGEQLDGLRARLAEFRDQSYEVRDASVPHPVAIQVSRDDTVGMVRDCRDLDPEGGVYDAETGELVDGGAAPGQRSLWETRLELIDDVWKVVDADLMEEDSGCDPAAS